MKIKKRFKGLEGKRLYFTGIVSEFGLKPGWREPEPTILLTDVTAESGDVADHVWFTLTKEFKGLQIGQRIEFCARVRPYEKGYVNCREGIDNRTMDNTLSHPTQIKVIGERACPAQCEVLVESQ